MTWNPRSIVKVAALVVLALLAIALPAAAQTRAQADSLRAKMVSACGAAKAADTQLTKAVAADSATRDVQFTELIRSRGFVRSSITQCTSSIAYFDQLLGRAPAPAPVPPAPPSTGSPFFADDGTTLTGTGRWTEFNQVSRVTFDGGPALRFRYRANPIGEDGWSELRLQLTPDAASAPTEVWMEYEWHVPLNYQHRGGAPTNNKFMTLWAETYSGGRDAQFYLSLERQSDTSSRLAIISIHGDDPRRNTERGWFEASNFVTPADFGKWMKVRIHARIARDGGVRVWKNGQLFVQTGPYNMVSAGANLNYFRHGYLMGWSNSGFTQQTDFHIRNLEIFRVNPGW